MRNTLKIIAFASLLSGCSGYGGKWPSLNDPLPDEKDRQRILATADVKVAPESYVESETMDFDSFKFRSIKLFAEVDAIWVNFNANFETINQTSDPEDKLIAWTGSQLTLSRMSAVVNTLRNLTEVPVEPLSVDVENYQTKITGAILRYDQNLIEAKKRIEEAKPK